ncbi:MAG: hypothetical protein QOD29_3165 [Alphaproteobacteria bacterium]|jgi:hypothetical protein|nr:hypothetical protein [Alphaproteobacteria bacterium]
MHPRMSLLRAAGTLVPDERSVSEAPSGDGAFANCPPHCGPPHIAALVRATGYWPACPISLRLMRATLAWRTESAPAGNPTCRCENTTAAYTIKKTNFG